MNTGTITTHVSSDTYPVYNKLDMSAPKRNPIVWLSHPTSVWVTALPTNRVIKLEFWADLGILLQILFYSKTVGEHLNSFFKFFNRVYIKMFNPRLKTPNKLWLNQSLINLWALAPTKLLIIMFATMFGHLYFSSELIHKLVDLFILIGTLWEVDFRWAAPSPAVSQTGIFTKYWVVPLST